MATSSLLGIDADNLPPAHSATGIDSLGPSDASDSGSDSAGAYSAETDSDTDRFGTGERGSVEPDAQATARDILPDHVEAVGSGESGSPSRGTRQGDAASLGPDDLPQDVETDDEAQEKRDAL